RTLVPTMMRYLMGHHAARDAESLVSRFFARFERGFERLRTAYGAWLGWALAHRGAVIVGFCAFVVASVAVVGPQLGRDFFPSVDAGLIKLHVRGVPGTRIEETEHEFAK